MELHIDIYSIILVNVNLTLFLYQLSKLFIRIKDEKLKMEVTKLLSNYSLASGSGDLILWPAILSAVYPFYVFIRLCFKRKLFLLIKTFWNDQQLLKTTASLFLLWVASTVSALFHWFLIYALTFLVGIVVAMHLYRKEKNMQA